MKRSRPEGRTVLITGATSGLGMGMADVFASRGYSLAITGRRQKAIEEVAYDIRVRHPGTEVHHYVLDVDELDSVSQVVRLAADDLGGLDIVVANAGIDGGGAVGEGNFASDRKVIHTNLLGAMATIDAAVELFREIGRGQVVAISSMAGIRGMAGGASYCASKAGLSVYAESARVELRKTDIVVTTLLPGYIDTPINRHVPNRPFVKPVEVGVREMVDLIEAEKGSAAVPRFPWCLLRFYLRVAPTSHLALFS